MKNKILLMFLTGVMATSLVACGGDKTKDASSVTTTDAKGASTESTKAAGTTQEELDLYGFKEPVTIKVGISYAADFKWFGDETVTDNAWLDLYKENNIITEVLYDVDPSQAEVKLATSIMSGNYPDIINSTTSDYKNYADSGVIADITEVFEKYASDELKAYLNSDEGMGLKSLYIDGKLYGLPRIGSPYDSAPMMFIRQDWLDKLGLSMPETMEDLKTVAHAFTYNDPDGNGKNDTYGVALDGMNVLSNNIGNTDPIFNAFGSYLGSNGMTYVKGENGEITWGGADTENMKKALQFLQDIYKDGSLAKDFITMNGDKIFQEAGAGRCGIWFGPNWAGMNPAIGAAKNDVKAHVVSAPVPDGVDQGGSKAYLASSINSIYSISSECENPEALIKLWNLNAKYLNPQSAPEEYNMYNGDSKNYTGWKTAIIYGGSISAGKDIYLTVNEALKTGDSSKLNVKQLENYTRIKLYIDAVKAGTFNPEDAEHQRGISLYTVYGDPLSAWNTITKMQKEDRYVQSAYNAIPSEKVTSSVGILKKILVENIVKITTGGASVDSYDAFLKTWYSMGGQDAMDEANVK